MKVPFFRTPYNYDTAVASVEAGQLCSGDSLTVQSMAEDADINVLMRRYGLTGKMPDDVRVPMYGDFTGVKDFKTALHAVMEAEDAFMALPAEVRARFENSPQSLLEFVENPGNMEEARKLGLLKPPPDKVEPISVVVAGGLPSGSVGQSGSAPQGAGVGA